MALNFAEIQGFVLSSYSKNLPCAAYVLLQVTDPLKTREWLRYIAGKITFGNERSKEASLNIAFTCNGFGKLGLLPEEVATFSDSFWEGMDSARRSKILGDSDDDAPQYWEWGSGVNSVDILLLVFASDEKILNDQLSNHDQAIQDFGGVQKLKVLCAGRQCNTKEHFGFVDGIGQPVIEGSRREDSQRRRTGHATIIRAGEFILGHRNEMDVYDPVPKVGGMKNFGENGTYLVFRQIEQNVPLFWNHMDQATRNADNVPDKAAQDRLAAKIIGRWPSGAPLTKYPMTDPGADCADNMKNDFEYSESDKNGYGCPVGAHIRRANPRDSLFSDPEVAQRSAKRHRIIRRGRSYGDRIEDRIQDDGKHRGLHFICLNAGIERQFEFIQQTWINNTTFGTLFHEADPLIGTRDSNSRFTMQEEPVRVRVHGLPKFVTIKGGAYFFMPSASALKHLAETPITPPLSTPNQ